MSLFSSVKDPERRKHFVDLFDKGQTDTFKLVVMQLLGPSIEDLRRFYLCTDFTLVFHLFLMITSKKTIELFHY